ncbi:hypothetical protein [Noviherbaspirillum cavernae]|uniref:hypothetical protein n=1 Tax=Noviherbaspirillum cavernae TaxID=2320862 RepID=UPI001313E4A9|nr:hypothetical protein [Noviherbaspirillum cavernae]
MNAPTGVARDAAGNLYVVDTGNFTIRKITPTTPAVVSTIAGTAGIKGAGAPTDDGVDAAAKFVNPTAIAVHQTDATAPLTLYVADGDSVRKITATTVNGKVQMQVQTIIRDASKLTGATGIAVDAAQNVYVADAAGKRVIFGTPAGDIDSLATGLDGPQGLALDAATNTLYITDVAAAGGATVIKKLVLPTTLPPAAPATVTTVAVTGTAQPFTNGAGIAVNAGGLVLVEPTRLITVSAAGVSAVVPIAAGKVTSLSGVVFDGTTGFDVTDSGNHTVSKVTTAGALTTLAGKAGTAGAVDSAP